MKSRTPSATLTPSSGDLHWAAGLLEGEGCFTPQRNQRGFVTARVDALQVDSWVIDRLLAMFGGTAYDVRRPNRQPARRWTATGARARGVMQTLYPLLSPRRQAKIIEVFSG